MSKEEKAKEKKKPVLKPLKIKCTSTDCGNGLHCFRKTKKMVAENQAGRCRACGVELVDWSRVHLRQTGDTQYTFTALRYELIRHHFWHIDIDEKAVLHARRKGKAGMRLATDKRIRRSVGAAEPVWDGRQTPMQGNAIFYAQHAVAACCRKCIAEWHGIPQGRALDENEIAYLAELANIYINTRLPFLTEDGEIIAKKRGKNVN